MVLSMHTGEWRCPFCQRDQVVGNATFSTRYMMLPVGQTKLGKVGLVATAIRCANAACNELTLQTTLTTNKVNDRGYDSIGEDLEEWQLRPQSTARPQPEYIPTALRNDYAEACLIRDLSPKASATLSRRCLQGMIRDFSGISKARLIDEINELRKQVEAGIAPKGVEPETVDAIDAVRTVGNIGAHMERDINMIVDVDPGEAQALIELIEMLFDEWYVARQTRLERVEKVKALAASKAADIAKMKAEKAAAESKQEDAAE